MKLHAFSFVPLLLAMACGTSPSAASLSLNTTQPGKLLRSNAALMDFSSVKSESVDAVRQANAAFGLNLYHALSKDPNNTGNLFMSPYSVSDVMAMVYAGAKGETAMQLATAMNFTLPPADFHMAMGAVDKSLVDAGSSQANNAGFTLNLSNDIWAQSSYPFQSAYLDLLSSAYNTGVHAVDFMTQADSVRLAINSWVSAKTNNKINNLLAADTVDTGTRLVLTNTVYFNGRWENQFGTGALSPFSLLDGTQANVQMMNLQADLNYTQGSNYEAVSLPYDNGQATMLVIVPAKGQFSTFESQFDATQLQALLTGGGEANVTLTMPKFGFDSAFSLGDTLQQLGAKDAFSPMLADFSGMDGTRNLYIGGVYHKAFIKVDEKGTEAAAATAAGMEAGAIMPPVLPQKVLTIDRPFMFAIVDNNNTVLFLGRVVTP